MCVGKLSAQELKGIVLDRKTGDLLQDVTVRNSNSGEIKYTDGNGEFRFDNIEFPVEIEFSFVGYLKFKKEFEANETQSKIFLEQDLGQLSEVVIRSSNIPQKI